MRTKLEKEIRHRRTRKGILVPLLEDLFARPVEIESDNDVAWITGVLQRMVDRQSARNERPLYSPSQLASCLRYVYLLKHRHELGFKMVGSRSVSAHYYFFTGNFLHLKWQFALHKLEEWVNDPKIFKLHGVEVPIVSKHKDHGGTVDGLCSVYEQPLIVDFKGLNVRSFTEITRGFVPSEYSVQLADYGMLYNSVVRNGESEISIGLLIAENKGGAAAKHPLALTEQAIPIKTYLPEVRSRLKELRTYGETNSIPPPECETTQGVQFKGCPFRKFCKEEVKEIERRKRKTAREDSKGLTVEVPSGRRNRNSRGNSRRRR